MFKVIILLQLAFGSVLGNVLFHDCGSAYELSSVNIQGCDDRIPCYVTVGEDVLVNLEFYAGLQNDLRLGTQKEVNDSPIADSEVESMDILHENKSQNLDFVSQNLDQDVVIHINHLNLRTQVSPERCGIYDCPVMTTDTVTSLTSVMSVPNSIALNQRGYLMWRIENEAGKQVLCYRVTVQTQSPLQKLLRQYMETVPIAPEQQP